MYCSQCSTNFHIIIAWSNFDQIRKRFTNFGKINLILNEMSRFPVFPEKLIIFHSGHFLNKISYTRIVSRAPLCPQVAEHAHHAVQVPLVHTHPRTKCEGVFTSDCVSAQIWRICALPISSFWGLFPAFAADFQLLWPKSAKGVVRGIQSVLYFCYCSYPTRSGC